MLFGPGQVALHLGPGIDVRRSPHSRAASQPKMVLRSTTAQLWKWGHN